MQRLSHQRFCIIQILALIRRHGAARSRPLKIQGDVFHFISGLLLSERLRLIPVERRVAPGERVQVSARLAGLLKDIMRKLFLRVFSMHVNRDWVDASPLRFEARRLRYLLSELAPVR